MSLDKWIKPEKDGKRPRKSKKNLEKVIPSEIESKKIVELKRKTFVRVVLSCPNTKCKYQKIIVKKELTDDDKICPRCEKIMQIKGL